MSWWKKLFGKGMQSSATEGGAGTLARGQAGGPARKEKWRTDSTSPLDSLVANLRHDDINISYPALQELQRRATIDPSLVPRIAEAFASVMLYVSPDGTVRFNNAAVRAIGDLGPQAESVVPKLVDLLHARPRYSPRPGLSPASLSAAMESVEQNLASLKHCAREALRRIGTPEALAAVERDQT